MRKVTLLIALSIFFSSCYNSAERYLSLNNTTIVLSKEEYSSGRAGTSYRVYIFDGKESNWYNCDYENYNRVKAGDTLTSLNITIVKYKSK